MSFEPTSGYSTTRTSTVFTDGENQQRAEVVASLNGDWVLESYSTDKSSAVVTDGVNKQRAVVTYNLNGGSGGGSVSGNYLKQLKTMPEASSNQGAIVQYVGETTEQYKRASLYESKESYIAPSIPRVNTTNCSVADINTFCKIVEKILADNGFAGFNEGDSFDITIDMNILEEAGHPVLAIGFRKGGAEDEAIAFFNEDYIYNNMGLSVGPFPMPDDRVCNLHFTTNSASSNGYLWNELMQEYATKEEIGNISTLLDAINGESI